MNDIKLMNIRHCCNNGHKVTRFDIYHLDNDAWEYAYSDYIHGTFKRHSTILQKHIDSNMSFYLCNH